MQEKFLERDYKSDIADFDNPDFQNRRSVTKRVDPIGEIKTVIDCLSGIFAALSFTVILWNYSPIMFIAAVFVKLPTYFHKNSLMKERRQFRISSDVLWREKNYYRGIPVSR